MNPGKLRKRIAAVVEEINEHKAERHKMQIELDEVGQRLEQMHKETELYKVRGFECVGWMNLLG